MHPVIMINPVKPAEKFLRWAIRLPVPIGIPQHQQVRGLTQIHSPTRPLGCFGYRYSKRAHQFRPLIKGAGSFRPPVAVSVRQDHHPVSFLTDGRLVAKLLAIIDRLTDPHPPKMVYIHGGGVDAFGLRREKRGLQTTRDLQCAHCLIRCRLPTCQQG